ncbi:hypothetical protein EDC01DRAFT_480951 [Geopyxis carbonaria]|nr:hypothetical protein EDC01DRAFT_480951 [Geopyxis carbonaria]
MSSSIVPVTNSGDMDEDEDEELQQMLREVQRRREKLKMEKQQAAMNKLAETPIAPAECETNSSKLAAEAKSEEITDPDTLMKDPDKEELTVPQVSEQNSAQEVSQSISTLELPSHDISEPSLDDSDAEETIPRNMFSGNQDKPGHKGKTKLVIPDDINQFPQELIDAINYKDPELGDFGAYAIAQVSPPAIGGDLRGFCVYCAHPGHTSMDDGICPRGRIERYLKNKDGDKSIYAGFSKEDSRIMFNSDFGHLVDGAVFCKTIGMSTVSDLEDFGLTTFTATHLRQLSLNIVDLKQAECLKFEYEETPGFKSLRELKCGYLTRFGKNYVGPVKILPVEPPEILNPVRPVYKKVSDNPEVFQEAVQGAADGYQMKKISAIVAEKRKNAKNKKNVRSEDIVKETSAEATSSASKVRNLKESLTAYTTITGPIVGNRPKTRCTTCKLPGHVYTTVRICPAEIMWNILDKSPTMNSSQWAKFKPEGTVAARHLRSVIVQLQRLGLEEVWGKLQDTIDQWENINPVTGRPRDKIHGAEQKNKRRHIPEDENWPDIPPLDKSKNVKYLEYFKNQNKSMKVFEQYVRKQKLKIYGTRSDSQCSMCLHYGHDKRSRECPMILATDALQTGPPAIPGALEYIESIREAYHWQSIFPDALKKDTHYIELFFSEVVPNAKYQWQKDAGRLPDQDIPESPRSPHRTTKRQKTAPANIQTQGLNVKSNDLRSPAIPATPGTAGFAPMVDAIGDQNLATLQAELASNTPSTTLQNSSFEKMDYVHDTPIQKDLNSASHVRKKSVEQISNPTALAGSQMHGGEASITANSGQAQPGVSMTPNPWGQTPAQPYFQQGQGYPMGQMTGAQGGQWTPQGIPIQNSLFGPQNGTLPYQNNPGGIQYDGRGVIINSNAAPQQSFPIGMVQQNWNQPSLPNSSTIPSSQMVPNSQNFQNTNASAPSLTSNNHDNVSQLPNPRTAGALPSPMIKNEKGSKKPTKPPAVSANGKRPLASKTANPHISEKNQAQGVSGYPQGTNATIPAIITGPGQQQFFGGVIGPTGAPMPGPGQFQPPYMQTQPPIGTFMQPGGQPGITTPQTAMTHPQQQPGMYQQPAMHHQMTMQGQPQLQNQTSMYPQAMIHQQAPMQSQSPLQKPGQPPSSAQKQQQNQGLPQLQQQTPMSQQPQLIQPPQIQYQRPIQQPGQMQQQQQPPQMMHQTPISQRPQPPMQTQPSVSQWGMPQQQPSMYPQQQPQMQQQGYQQWGGPNAPAFQQQPPMAGQQFYNRPAAFNQPFSGQGGPPPQNMPKNWQTPIQGNNMFNQVPPFNQGPMMGPGNPNNFNQAHGQINFNPQGNGQSFPPPG